ncbi:MAG: endonuclease MutS2, partial [Caldiserica bacterium]|nr:endonuclease MutS2 [Caldisericota bacterium]
MGVANERTLRDLEYRKVLELIARHAASSLGREAVLSLEPRHDLAAIRKEYGLVEEMREAVARGFVPGGLSDIRPILDEAREHGDLDPEKLLDVADFIEAAMRIRMELSSPRYPGLARLVERLSDQRPLLAAIRRMIDEHGRIREDATPTLRLLHRQRRELVQEITRKLRAFIDRHRELVQDPVITQRGGRLVVPMKSGAQGLVELVVHDTSASGQTVFAEPAAAVRDNNRLREIEDEIEREVRRIRAELVAMLHAEERDLLRDVEILARVDSLYARTRYAEAAEAVVPELSEAGAVELVEARHPLLGDRAVPITIAIGDPRRMVVITGPNTGGKTVTLKTIGLFALLAQAGIPLPASPRTRLRIFRKVRSDIGEEQSIEQSLSTFSSHMTNIVGILGEADADTLILLDELGAGTDPQEGAALGLAILEYLLATGATVAVATHLTPLKNFAIMHPEVKSCSMEFDLETLSPTYRVLEGVPGSSCALIIAERLGLAPEIVAAARSHFSSGEVRAEEIIRALTEERSRLERARRELEEELSRTRTLREEYERRLERLRERRRAELGRELARLEEEIRRAKREIERLISSAKEGDLAARRAALKRLEELSERVDALSPRRAGPAPRFEVGQTVRFRATKATGVVRAVDGERVEVEVKGKRIWLDPRELEPVRGTRPAAPSRPQPEVRVKGGVDLELYVHGMKVQEALRAVEAWLDKLLISGFHVGHIIHGKG